MNMKNLKDISPLLFKYKYVFITAFFFVWISLFSENSCYERKRLRNKKEMLKEQRDYYVNKIKKDSTKLNQLKADNDNLEKFARENYFMSKKNEDVFVVP